MPDIERVWLDDGIVYFQTRPITYMGGCEGRESISVQRLPESYTIWLDNKTRRIIGTMDSTIGHLFEGKAIVHSYLLHHCFCPGDELEKYLHALVDAGELAIAVAVVLAFLHGEDTL